jgi:hypothetical protein
MDPLSAVVAFAGFSASLITIIDTISKLSITLIEVQRKFKDSPRKLSQLCRDLENLRALLEAIHTRFSVDEAAGFASGFQTIGESFIKELGYDLQDLQAIIDDAHSKSRLPLSKGLTVKIRHLLVESTINDYHRRISTHICNLIMVQNLFQE